MTIQSSGVLMYPATINSELRRSASNELVTPDATTRWLSERSSGPVIIPNHFYGKSAVKLVASYGHGSAATSHSQSSVSFGPTYPGRRIVVVINVAFNAPHAMTISNLSVGGSSGSGNSQGSQDGSNSAGIGIFLANPSGASGTVSFNTTNLSRARVWVLSVAGITSRHDWDFTATATNPGGSMSVNVPSNGVLIAGYTRYATPNHSYGGISARGNEIFNLSAVRASYAWTNRLNSQSNRTVTVSPTGTAARGGMVASYS